MNESSIHWTLSGNNTKVKDAIVDVIQDSWINLYGFRCILESLIQNIAMPHVFLSLAAEVCFPVPILGCYYEFQNMVCSNYLAKIVLSGQCQIIPKLNLSHNTS